MDSAKPKNGASISNNNFNRNDNRNKSDDDNNTSTKSTFYNNDSVTAGRLNSPGLRA